MVNTEFYNKFSGESEENVRGQIVETLKPFFEQNEVLREGNNGHFFVKELSKFKNQLCRAMAQHEKYDKYEFLAWVVALELPLKKGKKEYYTEVSIVIGWKAAKFYK